MSDPTCNASEIKSRIARKSIEDDVIQIQIRSMSDPFLSDIEFKNEMTWVWRLWTTLKPAIVPDRPIGHWELFSFLLISLELFIFNL